MKPEEISDKIRFILEPITESPSDFYSGRTANQLLGIKGKFNNENVELLLQLESKLPSGPSKEFFWELIGYKLIVTPLPIPKFTGKPISQSIRKAQMLVQRYCDCAFMVFLRLRKADGVLKNFSDQLNNYNAINDRNYKIMYCIFQALSNEPTLFIDEYLNVIEVIINKYSACVSEASRLKEDEDRQKNMLANTETTSLSLPSFISPQIPIEPVPAFLPTRDSIRKADSLASESKTVLRKIRFERVKEELKGVSSQINQDKKQLVSKYKDLKFSAELIQSLDKIDTEVEKAGSKFDYSQTIGFVRNIYEESLRQITKKIYDSTKLSIPKWTDRGKLGESLDYFKKINFVTNNEMKMLTGFAAFISDAGSHSLTSERYETRIAMNILVEICSYLADKIDTFLSKNI